ncbi:imidazole glycerol phosphate synthase subunit HisH [Bartonella tamiae]|uniref:Imidazole glycerol phosphate synthase subunit HisH n=1 Tax=Bartonella tamiae Th239 TaxID=1094558 RepID=J1K0X6_9HYPH|nr:imidazole glycerol phosphate synthase subunit HisH [Bartonella tamiae]EJF91087.1 imidazole glycerol phosphate synthase, glutamine amidotransferase subunit [Bartonella tamiae Th239]EJF93248.1 imidazole glycerol phosphate synthase, glutamine amidotransferase subunit [Bartonella tamiae Th307]
MRVVIIDYGSGNLNSVQKAFERASQKHHRQDDIILSNKADDVLKADRIVLPGVGAYGDCMMGLKTLENMVEALNEAVQVRARPFMGICVGMQLMANRGMEKKQTLGLGWIDGDVTLINPTHSNLKIPHMGWNTVALTRPHPLFQNIHTGPSGSHAYFVHSYHMECKNPDNVLATTDYGGTLCAAILHDTMFGTQFHPEKSQKFGLTLIANFLDWTP